MSDDDKVFYAKLEALEAEARAAFPAAKEFSVRVNGGVGDLPFRLAFDAMLPGLDGSDYTFFDEHDLRRLLLRLGSIVRDALERQATARAKMLDETKAQIALQAAAMADVERRLGR